MNLVSIPTTCPTTCPTTSPTTSSIPISTLVTMPAPQLMPMLGPITPPGTPPPPSSRRALNEREKQVLRLVCEGMSNAEIALRLGVSRDSIKTELKRIFHKISVRNRTQAAVLVVSHSML